MAFPFLSEFNGELGTNGHFDSEVDTDNKLDVMHYSDMARIPGLPAPWHGAFALVSNLSKGVNTAYLQEDTSWDLSASGTIFFRFFLYLSRDLTMATTDEFILLNLQSAGPIDEAVIVINYTTTNGFRIGIGETAGTSFLPISLGTWHCVEAKMVIDSGVPNDGTIDLWLDGSAATQVTALDQAAIIQGRFGTMGIDAGTTKGFVVMDDLIADEARLFPVSLSHRWTLNQLFTASGHAFVGPGRIDNLAGYAGAATDLVVTLFDTDTGDATEASRAVAELKNVSNNESVDKAAPPFEFRRGCFVQLAGTTPRAQLMIGRATAYGSDGRVRQFGFDRKREVGNE
jgi:hypothetical protein